MKEYKNEKEFENELQEMDDCPDLVNIGGVVYTMDNYDKEGSELSFGNKKQEKGFIITTEDRYLNGFSDAVVEEIDCVCFRNDIIYYE